MPDFLFHVMQVQPYKHQAVYSVIVPASLGSVSLPPSETHAGLQRVGGRRGSASHSTPAVCLHPAQTASASFPPASSSGRIMPDRRRTVERGLPPGEEEERPDNGQIPLIYIRSRI